MKKIKNNTLLIAGLIVTALGGSNSFAAQDARTIVGHSVKNMVTRPLSELARASHKRIQAQSIAKQQPSLLRRDSATVQPMRELPWAKQASALRSTKRIIDQALQSSAPSGLMPAPGISFDGINNSSGVLPPDTNGDVGPNNYMQTVNTAFAIWDKSGKQLIAPTPVNALWTGFGGICESHNDGDPIVLYDQLADRWMMSQFALGFPDNFHQCIAVSKTGDPTGQWYLYDFKISNVKMNDYPHFGIWSDGYYMTMNQFDGASNAWAGAGVVAFERDNMLQGLPAQMIYKDLENVDSSLGGMLPADMDGLIPPPAGTPNYVMQFDSTKLQLWKFHVDWSTPTNSTFTKAADLAVDGFNNDYSCGRNCVNQPGGTALDAIQDRLMYRLAYRNYGDHESIVLNHTVSVGSGQWAPRWYEIRNPSTTPVVYQQGTFAPDGDSRWMGSIAMDAVGNIALGYSVTGASTYPSVRYAGRLASDPLGKMAQGEAELVAGAGSQSSSSGRWGDYSMMSVDPGDDCTFWYTQEYYAADSNSGWSTRIGSFKFPNCVSGPSGTLAGMVTDAADGSPLANALIKIGAITTTSDASGNYSVSLPVGDYGIEVKAYGYGADTQTALTVKEDATTTADSALIGLPTVTLSGQISDASGHGWPLYASVVIGGELVPATKVYTDPETGKYNIDLFVGWPYTVTAHARVGAYHDQSTDVTLGATPAATDFGLTLDTGLCSAPGYQAHGLKQDFNGVTFPPAGWTVIDNAGSGMIFKLASTWTRGNLTGGSGGAADADSDMNYGVPYDTELLSPEINVADLSSRLLQYKAWFQQYSGLEAFDLDISVDGGAWSNVLTHTFVGAQAMSVDLSTATATATTIRLRWHYYTSEAAPWDYFAEIDDITLGTACTVTDGSLVVGYVSDANTLQPINTAVAGSSTSFATPQDSLATDGLYVTFAATGQTPLSYSKANYTSIVDTLSIESGKVVRHDVALPAGKLAITAIDLAVTTTKSTSASYQVSNVGSAGASFSTREFNAPVQAPAMVGHFDPSYRKFSPDEAYAYTAKGMRSAYSPPAVPMLAAGQIIDSFDTNLAYGWGLAFVRDSGNLWLSNLGVAGGDDQDHEVTPTGVLTGQTIDVVSMLGNGGWPADATYDDRSQTLWQIGVGTGCIFEASPTTDAVTGRSICPGFAASQQGLAYDVRTDTFYSGGWSNQLIYQFDRSGTILNAFNIGLPIAGMAFNPSTHHLFVAANSDKGLDVYVVDVDNAMAFVGGFHIEDPASGISMSKNGEAGLALDCDGNLWTIDQNVQKVFKVSSGETGVCDLGGDIAWMNTSDDAATLDVNGVQNVSVSLDASNLQPGSYSASVLMPNDTPYGTLQVPVNLTVNPWKPGVLQFAVSSVEISETKKSVTLNVSRSAGLDGAVSVAYATQDGDATAAQDYQATSGTLTWADEDVADKSITINIRKNSVAEGDEVFLVRLSSPTGGAVVGDDMATVKIKDYAKGGSLGWFTLTLLGMILLTRRRYQARSGYRSPR